MARLRVLLVYLVVAVLAGCGGKSKPAPFASTSHIAIKPGLLGDAASAGTVRSYVPTGKIVADSGFRPALNGFAFENYGNDAGPVNLVPANVEHLFGPKVCLVGSGASCVLTPSAKAWMQHENQAMADGHCMGFSVTALRLFSHNLSPSTFGASTAPALPIVGNTALQSEIAEDWAYQSLPAVQKAGVYGTPAHVLRALVSALNAGNEQYTLAIIKQDGTGGHAITPFAVEDKGNGRFAILVYDNNFPGVVRAVDVDTRADTWQYIGGPNPSFTDEIYRGDAQTQSMGLFPTTPGEGTQPCPFCGPGGGSLGPVTTAPSSSDYVEVTLSGQGAEHAHLVFVDRRSGLQTGFVHGRLLQQIPGILVVRNYAVQNWNAAPEPTFELPANHPPYLVLVDGTALSKPTTANITVNGDNVVFSVVGVHIAPGQKDQMLLPSRNRSLEYASFSHRPETPLLVADFGQRYRADNSRARFIAVTAASIGYEPGSAFSLQLDSARNVVLYGSGAGVGTAKPRPAGSVPGGPRHIMSLDALPLPQGHGQREEKYVTGSLTFDPNRQVAGFDYFNPHGASLPIAIIDHGTGRTLHTVRVPASHGPSVIRVHHHGH